MRGTLARFACLDALMEEASSDPNAASTRRMPRQLPSPGSCQEAPSYNVVGAARDTLPAGLLELLSEVRLQLGRRDADIDARLRV